MHTLQPWDTHVIHAYHEKRKRNLGHPPQDTCNGNMHPFLSVADTTHAMVTCTLFCQWQTQPQAVGRAIRMSIRSGRMVMQTAAVLFGSNLDATHIAAAPLPPSDQDLIRNLKSYSRVRYHSTKAGCDKNVSLLGAFKPQGNEGLGN